MNIFKTPEGYLYSNRALLALFIPLLIEYGLEFFVGFADSVMVWLHHWVKRQFREFLSLTF